MSLLKAEKAAGKANMQTHRDLSKAKAEYERKLRDFSCFAPPYDGNPSKVFDWCGKLEKHLSRFKCETIPKDTIKRMLLLTVLTRLVNSSKSFRRSSLMRRTQRAGRWNTWPGDRQE